MAKDSKKPESNELGLTQEAMSKMPYRKSGHKGGAATAYAEGRSGSSGSGRSGSTSQRNTSR